MVLLVPMDGGIVAISTSLPSRISLGSIFYRARQCTGGDSVSTLIPMTSKFDLNHGLYVEVNTVCTVRAENELVCFNKRYNCAAK